MRMQALWSVAVFLAGLGLLGCGTAAPNCDSQLVFAVSPATGTADHAAKAPGNQQQFQDVGSYRAAKPGCAVPALAVLQQADWTVSDPVNVSISSAKDGTNGLATCLGATPGPVTVTASGVATTATLTCQ